MTKIYDISVDQYDKSIHIIFIMRFAISTSGHIIPRSSPTELKKLSFTVLQFKHAIVIDKK